MTTEIFDSEEDITIDEIKTAEILIGKRFPQEYIDFLLTNNGGCVEPEYFNISWANQEWSDESSSFGMIDCFLSIYDGEAMNFITENTISYKGRIPENTIIIGKNPGRSLILLGVNDDNLGKVYFWHGEYEEDEDDANYATYSNIGFVADSLPEFLDSLHER